MDFPQLILMVLAHRHPTQDLGAVEEVVVVVAGLLMAWLHLQVL
jgi:hypothetical protein